MTKAERRTIMRSPDCRTCPLYEDHKARAVAAVVLYGMTFDPRTGVVTHKGRETRLTHHEAMVMGRLLRQPGDTVPRASLYSALYGDDEDGGPYTAVLDVYLARIRRKLEGIAAPIEIRSVPRQGVRVVSGFQA